jgi:hypothetical protein
MALHDAIQRFLLIGVRLDRAPTLPPAHPPERLAPLIAALEPAHGEFDLRAIHYGHLYRSGYWAIYLLSALAVLFAVMPLALGWDTDFHYQHPYAKAWAFGEVLLIGTVSAVYWFGQRRDWQGQWLRARTAAELLWYLPVLAPLLQADTPANPESGNSEPNWYLRVFDPGQHVRGGDEIGAHCARLEPLARTALAGAWSDGEFVAEYARWAGEILEHQRRYHAAIVVRQHALQHRVHWLTALLFGLTGLGAVLHLLVHKLWLSLVTIFFPALGASLHGALAQSEAYRLETSSRRLTEELAKAIERIRAAAATPAPGCRGLQAAVEAAIALILEEHQDWNLLVRPHRLPLA